MIKPIQRWFSLLVLALELCKTQVVKASVVLQTAGSLAGLQDAPKLEMRIGDFMPVLLLLWVGSLCAMLAGLILLLARHDRRKQAKQDRRLSTSDPA